jgi:acyl dehydratase
MSTHRTADVAVGDSSERTFEAISRTEIVRYVGASGEFNPNHYDEEYATQAGHSDVFANGMFSMGLASTILCTLVPLGAVRSFETRFTAPVWPNDDVTVRVDVVAVSDTDPAATVSIQASTQASEQVLDGEAIVDCS